DAAELQKVLVALVGKGIQQVVLPADLTDRAGWTADLARALAVHRKIPHRVVALSPKGELREQVLYPLPTAAVYPADTRAADCLHRALSTSLPHDIPRVNIVQAGLYIASEHGRLVDRVDGMVTSMGRLLESSDEPAFALF
ncbi:MAG TPA: hypothetical protein VLA19_12795, partial [Herpetosiphonaceae bacterium]|nr:hypothetical protein [Herpetosiphonaceae bacterium]